MTLHFFKYQGTGNDFIMIDNRQKVWRPGSASEVARLCDRKFGIGADGLILLENEEGYDFKMIYFNADGRESTMCGNGGRCISRFAADLQLVGERCTFKAIDGGHEARIHENEVSLQMIDVSETSVKGNDIFVDTGSPHHVVFGKDIASSDINTPAREIRYSEDYAPGGVNVNYVEILKSGDLYMRTYERGVEDETLSCGTGVTAAAIAAYQQKKITTPSVGIISRGGRLSVSFRENQGSYTDIWLTGPAEFVFKGDIEV